MKHIQLLSLFYKWGDWGIEGLSDLPKDTQLVSGGARRSESRAHTHEPLLYTVAWLCPQAVFWPWHPCREPTSLRKSDGPQTCWGLIGKSGCWTSLWSHAGGAARQWNHWASWQRQCASPNTSRQNNKHRWLPQLRSLNTEVEPPCLAPCGDTSVEKSRPLLLSRVPRGKIWGCLSSPVGLLPPLSSPQSQRGLVWCEPAGEPPNPTVSFTGL